jgi:hypothetical protein
MGAEFLLPINEAVFQIIQQKSSMEQKVSRIQEEDIHKPEIWLIGYKSTL